jgi:hypothetical protein
VLKFKDPYASMPEYKTPVWPDPESSDEVLDAFYEERERIEAEYSKWEHETRWTRRFHLALVLLLIPIGAIFWGIGIVKERFKRGR